MNKTYQRWTAGLLLSLVGTLLWMVCAFGAGQSNSDYTIDRDVFGSGGRASSCTAYQQIGTLGQIAVDTSSNDDYSVDSGFWHRRTYVLTVFIRGMGQGFVKDCLTATECPGTRIYCSTKNIPSDEIPDDLPAKPRCTAVYGEDEQVLLKAFPCQGSSFTEWLVLNIDTGMYEAAPVPLYSTHDLNITAQFIDK